MDARDLRPRLVVCADDFGQHDGVNRAVLELAARGSVSAASCLVDAPAFRGGAHRLRESAELAIDVGLHLNLTEAFSAGQAYWRWPALVAASYAGQLDVAALRARIGEQLDAFEQALGRAPDFVDGHRHVHQLPVVRDALIDLLADRYPQRMPWLRCTRPARLAGAPAAERLKARVIAALGSGPFERLAERRGFAHSDRLLGVWGFRGNADGYRRRMLRWLAAARDGDVLMCHPATPTASRAPADPIATARCVEYQVLADPAFADAVAAAGLAIGPLRRAPAAARGVTPW